MQVAKGLAVMFCPDFEIDKTLAVYADAACTQLLEEGPDLPSDSTVYIKRDE